MIKRSVHKYVVQILPISQACIDQHQDFFSLSWMQYTVVLLNGSLQGPIEV